MSNAPSVQVPELSGLWAREYFGFEPPLSGPGAITAFHQADGKIDREHQVGDYTNPILKPEAAATLKARGDITMSGRNFPQPTNQCAPQPTPYIFWQQEFQLIQAKDKVVILYMHDAHVRRVRLNSQHPAQLTPSWSGDSIGHYEGDTLVVDTVGVKVRPLAMVDGFGTPQSEAVHSIERYRLVDYQTAIDAHKRGENDLLFFAGDDGTGDGVAVDRGYMGQGLQLTLTVEDTNVFNTPWSAIITYERAAGDFVERICAENLRESDGSIRTVPTDDTPDF